MALVNAIVRLSAKRAGNAVVLDDFAAFECVTNHLVITVDTDFKYARIFEIFLSWPQLVISR